MQRENFGNRFGVLVAMAGSAIGLGNLWRFPYMVGEYGGAACRNQIFRGGRRGIRVGNIKNGGEICNFKINTYLCPHMKKPPNNVNVWTM